MVEFVLLRTVEFVLLRTKGGGGGGGSNEWCCAASKGRRVQTRAFDRSIDRHWCCMCLDTQASTLEVRASVSRFIMNGKFKVSALAAILANYHMNSYAAQMARAPELKIILTRRKQQCETAKVLYYYSFQ